MPDTCRDLMAKAHTYVSKKVVDWPDDLIRTALTDPQVKQWEDRMNHAALANDFQACAAACRGWWKAILAHTPAVTELSA